MSESEFAQVVAQGVALQRRLAGLELVAVGGTAAALHSSHRFSLDVDCVSASLQPHFEEVLDSLEQWEGWRTNRRNPPVLILGEREGVELGVRQQRRLVALQTTTVQGLVISTAAETLRIKAFLLSERRATRDFIDVAALARHLGNPQAVEALSYLNLLYAPQGSQSAVTRFAEGCESEPIDLAQIELSSYKGLQAPFTDWGYVAPRCRELGRELVKRELNDVLPRVLGADVLRLGSHP